MKNKHKEVNMVPALYKTWVHATFFFDRHKYRDARTGLKNREALFKAFEFLYINPAVIALSINNLSSLNNSFGEEHGNLIINKTKNILFDRFGKSFDIYKISQSGFVLICEHYSGFEENIAVSVLDFLECLTRAEDFTMTAGIGVGPKALYIAEEMLKKANDDGCLILGVDGKLAIEKDYKLSLEFVKKIQKALKNDLIIPYFQPIYNASTKRIDKVECLVRMIDPDDITKIIMPGSFLQPARSAKLYTDITKAMLLKSVEMLKDSDLEFSINLGVLDLMNKEIKAMLLDIARTNVASRMTIELLESEDIEKFLPEILTFIKHIKTYNVSIAIDDFGSGFSNHSIIPKVKPSLVKIDGSIVTGLKEDESYAFAYQTIKSLVATANDVGFKTVAEFVSDKVLFDLVKHLGVDYIQGYYVSAPVSSLEEVKAINLTYLEENK